MEGFREFKLHLEDVSRRKCDKLYISKSLSREFAYDGRPFVQDGSAGISFVVKEKLLLSEVRMAEVGAYHYIKVDYVLKTGKNESDMS